MSEYFKELDHVPTRIGALSLRRRRHLSLGVDVYEIMLGNAFLMTSCGSAPTDDPLGPRLTASTSDTYAE